MPDVSVVIPVYNGRAFVERAIASALGQTLASIEVIVVDDASQDGTPALVEGLAARDPRLRLVAFALNRGPSAARNAGFAAARGRWIAILDADDWYEPGRLERLVRGGDERGADLVCDDLVLFDEEAGAAIGPMFGPGGLPPEIDGERFVLGNLPDPERPRRGYGFLKPLMRRAFVDERGLRYDEAMRFAEDYAFYVETFLAGARWIAVEGAGYVYVIRSGSLTATHQARDLFRLCAVDTAALERVGDGRMRRALRRHLLTTQKRAAWAHFIDLFKERRIGPLWSTATMNLPVFAHIAGQCAIQAVERSRVALGARLGLR